MRVMLLVLAGCSAATPPEGIPCGPDLECPSTLICAFGECVAELPPCVPIENGAGKLVVPRVDRPLALDGDLADWPTCFVSVDPTSAGLVRDLGAGGNFTPGRFSLVADADHLYVGAEVQVVRPLGDQPPPEVYLNNAISVYFDADGVITAASYDANAAQIVVDHANRSQGFHSGSLLDVVIDSAATVGTDTFTIEMAVTPQTFGVNAFADTIGFDIGLVGGDGMTMTSELVWFQACEPPICGCPSGTDAAPYCDALEFGRATFQSGQ